MLETQLKQELTTIDEKIKSLGGPIDYKFKSPGAFKYNELDGNTVALATCVDVNYLIKSLAKMKRVKEEYEETAKDLGLTVYPVLTWYGSPIDNWISDLSFRIRVVSNATQINQLVQSRAELTQFLSAEDRLRATLENVSKNLK